jgi:hypothetical protein
VKQKDADTYSIQLINLDYELPIEIVTSSGKQKIKIGKTAVTVTSKTLPIIDPDVFYLKKVIIE